MISEGTYGTLNAFVVTRVAPKVVHLVEHEIPPLSLHRTVRCVRASARPRLCVCVCVCVDTHICMLNTHTHTHTHRCPWTAWGRQTQLHSVKSKCSGPSL